MSQDASQGGGVSGGDIAVVAAQVSAAMYNYYGKVLDVFTIKKRVKWEQMPDYSNPLDYQAQKTYTIEIIIGAMFILFTIVVLAIAFRK